LDEHLALLQKPLQHEVDVELAVVRVAHADRDVLEIDEERKSLFVLMIRCQKPSSCGGHLEGHPQPGAGWLPGRGARENPGPRGSFNLPQNLEIAKRTGDGPFRRSPGSRSSSAAPRPRSRPGPRSR